jgi:hypothetical protein
LVALDGSGRDRNGFGRGYRVGDHSVAQVVIVVTTMRWITAAPLLVLMLIAGQPAAAQTATVINLSCDGTVKNGDTEPVRKMGLVVNLAQHTVVGFVPLAHITRLDDVNVDFGGETGTPLGGSSSVHGGIDRVTGATWISTVLAAKDGKIISTQVYDLFCKVTSRLF